MKIEHYSFGRITVSGKTYTSDVIIYPGRVDPSWWRKEGHLLQTSDLDDIIAEKPSVLIVGTGAYGAMKVPEKTLKYVKSEEIEVHCLDTIKAVELFNSLFSERAAVAALHLTC